MKKDPTRGNDYGIGAVARMTGLSTQVIRAWERRYGAVVARRAENGRRLYDAADVEKLTLLKALTERGSSIGAVAGLDMETLRERAAEMDQIATRPLPAELRVAVLGALLPRLLSAEVEHGRPFDIVAADADPA
ncbi:MAG: MerR family transcriptional regulator, partial [Gammaproteobacteria bacterium]